MVIEMRRLYGPNKTQQHSFTILGEIEHELFNSVLLLELIEISIFFLLGITTYASILLLVVIGMNIKSFIQTAHMHHEIEKLYDEDQTVTVIRMEDGKE